MPVDRAEENVEGAVIRVYADTSVFGGVFDEEFARPSQAFFESVRRGRFQLVISAVVRDELAEAPENVRAFSQQIRLRAQEVDVTGQAVRLQKAYLAAGVVGPASEFDALHVAVATTSGCRVIVSWNFRHIVNFQKIPLYNGVNLARGYGTIAIHSPQEVVADVDQGQDI